MNEQRIKEVFSDEAFVKSILEMETPEQVQAALKEKGIDLTIDDIMKIQKGLASGDMSQDELSSEDLDEVAGGIAPVVVLGIIAGVVSVAGALGDAINTAVRRRW